MPQQFFYDGSVRKWITQIIRVFSNFTVEYGLDSNDNQLYSTVPVIWGDSTFSAATIQRLNSENVLASFPIISIYINNLKYDVPRRQNPTFEDTFSVRTRQWDANIGSYLPQQGNAYTVKRLMPSPYLLDIKVDIVTSNTQQKLQILEQILPLFNPSIEIQKTDDYLDWESLSYIELKDVTWSSRTIPTNQNMDSSYDVCTLQFEAPIYLSLPTQVSKMGVIFKIITNIKEMKECDDLIFGRQVITFNNYGVYATDNQIRILNQGVEKPGLLYGAPLDVTGILSAYGNIRAGVSQIGLTYDGSPNHEILGTITVNPMDSTILLYNVSSGTLPSNTLPSIISIVDPLSVAPGYGLANANVGQSYLITSNIGTSWPYDTANSNASASKNDIITYTGSAWNISFDADENIGNVQFVYNNSSNLQIRWDGNAWVDGWQGPYNAANWRMII